MPSSHQLTLASQLARLRPTIMPGLGQDVAGPGASLAAAAAAASLGLPFSLSHHHGLSLSNLGLGLPGMVPNPERQGIMAGFGMTTPQIQVCPKVDLGMSQGGSNADVKLTLFKADCCFCNSYICNSLFVLNFLRIIFA